MAGAAPTTVAQYLAGLPPAVRAEVEAVRRVILDHLDADYEEGIQYGMIGYYVPHRIHPAGYACDPRQPLPLACLGAKKNHISLHFLPLYGDPATARWFGEELAKSGRKLDMGKACIRFRTAAELPLGLIGRAFARTPARAWAAACQAAVAQRAASKPGKKTAKTKAARG